jgi:hypothetical protein
MYKPNRLCFSALGLATRRAHFSAILSNEMAPEATTFRRSAMDITHQHRMFANFFRRFVFQEDAKSICGTFSKLFSAYAPVAPSRPSQRHFGKLWDHNGLRIKFQSAKNDVDNTFWNTVLIHITVEPAYKRVLGKFKNFSYIRVSLISEVPQLHIQYVFSVEFSKPVHYETFYITKHYFKKSVILP